MIAVDSSVAIAGLLAAHENHDAARSCLEAERPRLVAHAAFETYSVLTRLPLPDRLDPVEAWTLLGRHFPSAPLVLRARSLQRLLAALAGSGVCGGAVYDGLVAGTAKEHGAELVTLDRRAVPTYRAVGVSFRILGEHDEMGTPTG